MGTWRSVRRLCLPTSVAWLVLGEIASAQLSPSASPDAGVSDAPIVEPEAADAGTDASAPPAEPPPPVLPAPLPVVAASPATTQSEPIEVTVAGRSRRARKTESAEAVTVIETEQPQRRSA